METQRLRLSRMSYLQSTGVRTGVALNHLNLANPVLSITSSSLGQITSARSADFGGNRTGQIGARIDF